MGEKKGNWHDVDKIFAGKDRNLTVLSIALVAGLYAALTGDTKPFAVFVFTIAILFLFDLVNYILGKINS
ncbi:MAG: hypothetical protein GOU98_04950 [Candidatus Altiarchaeota archaeon]|nr:hypothetical protein [Candidatus Altiarchaeota archaeon]